jgi:hypothetical protein
MTSSSYLCKYITAHARGRPLRLRLLPISLRALPGSILYVAAIVSLQFSFPGFKIVAHLRCWYIVYNFCCVNS